MALTYAAITPARYAQIVPATSPLAGLFSDLTTAAQQEDVNPLLLLAWLRSENDFATDISAGLLAIHNAAGIKYVGQSHAYQSDQLPPANEQGVYAGFRTWADFFATLAVNIKTILPDAWARGDLASIASYYTSGDPSAGAGANKVTFFNEYEGGSMADSQTAIYGEDIIAKARQYIGQANSDGTLDTINGVHPWAYFCEAFAESVPRALGLPQVARPTALDKGNAMQAQGLFRNGPPQHGDWMIFGARFFVQGHICFFDAEKGMALGTLTDGTGIGYANYGPNSPGYMGCAPVPGVAGTYRVAPAPAPTVVPPNNPYNHGITDTTKLIGVGGGFKALFEATPNPLAVYGWPMANEVDALVMEPDGTRNARTVQFFERAVMVYNAAMPAPWDVTLALRAQTVVPR